MVVGAGVAPVRVSLNAQQFVGNSSVRVVYHGHPRVDAISPTSGASARGSSAQADQNASQPSASAAASARMYAASSPEAQRRASAAGAPSAAAAAASTTSSAARGPEAARHRSKASSASSATRSCFDASALFAIAQSRFPEVTVRRVEAMRERWRQTTLEVLHAKTRWRELQDLQDMLKEAGMENSVCQHGIIETYHITPHVLSGEGSI